jgi:hypothetical protein
MFGFGWWVDGWMDGGVEVVLKDCLPQSKNGCYPF